MPSEENYRILANYCLKSYFSKLESDGSGVPPLNEVVTQINSIASKFEVAFKFNSVLFRENWTAFYISRYESLT